MPVQHHAASAQPLWVILVCSPGRVVHGAGPVVVTAVELGRPVVEAADIADYTVLFQAMSIVSVVTEKLLWRDGLYLQVVQHVHPKGGVYCNFYKVAHYAAVAVVDVDCKLVLVGFLYICYVYC